MTPKTFLTLIHKTVKIESYHMPIICLNLNPQVKNVILIWIELKSNIALQRNQNHLGPKKRLSPYKLRRPFEYAHNHRRREKDDIVSTLNKTF